MEKNSSLSKVLQSVVRIHIKGMSDQHPKSILDPRMIAKDDWLGSGFFIQSPIDQNIYILTNAHVVKNAIHIEIRSGLTSDEPFKAELIGLIESLEPDVALLKLSKEEEKRFKKIARIKKIPTLKLGNSEKLNRGITIKAIGFPMGMLEPNTSGGEITNFISGSLSTVERIVTDAAINPGNSGGPAILKNGEVFGINTSIILDANNISFITPIHLVKKFIPHLISGKKIELAHLGAYLQKNSPALSQYLHYPKVQGIILNKILKGSLASKAKLKPGDLLIAINNQKLDRHGNVLMHSPNSHQRNLYDILHMITIEEEVELQIFRNKKLIKLKTKYTGNHSDELVSLPLISSRKNLYFEGMLIQEVCTEILDSFSEIYGVDQVSLFRDFQEANSKLIITSLDEESQALELDFHVGDYICEVQNKKIKTVKDFLKALDRPLTKNSTIKIKTASGAIGVFEIKK